MLFVVTSFLTSVFHLLCYRVSLAVEKMRGHGITFSETEDAQLELLIQDRVIAKTLQERLRVCRRVTNRSVDGESVGRALRSEVEKREQECEDPYAGATRHVYIKWAGASTGSV